MNKAILNDIRILDFTRVLAGPYATRLLADFSAEVIKVGYPGAAPGDNTFDNAYYNTWNRNKRGITLNIDTPEGQAVIRKLVAVSDAVMENFTPRVMENWGLDYPNLVLLKPDIIMVSMSVMGQTGPYRNYTGFGPTVQAFSGITSLTAYPGGAPLGPGVSYADHVAGLFASLALLNALEYRRRTGKGQHIDLSETETMAYLMGDAFADYTLNGKTPQPQGNASLDACPHDAFRCRGTDRWCAIAVFTDTQWQSLKRCMGNPAWADEKRFSTLSDRLSHVQELNRHVEEWTLSHTAEEVMTLLQREGIPAGVVQNAADIANDPQLNSRGFFMKSRQEQENALHDANPIRLSDNPVNYYKPAPSPDNDNAYVFKELLGMTEEEVYELKRKGVI